MSVFTSSLRPHPFVPPCSLILLAFQPRFCAIFSGKPGGLELVGALERIITLRLPQLNPTRAPRKGD